MKGFLKELTRMGVSIAEFERVSRVSFQTLKRIDAGSTVVRPVTLSKARRALDLFREEFESQTPAKRAVSH